MPDDTPDTPHGPTCPLSTPQLWDVFGCGTNINFWEEDLRRVAIAAITADRARIREAIGNPGMPVLQTPVATAYLQRMFDSACAAVDAKAREGGR